MPNGQTLVLANGGLDTHPDCGPQVLNLPKIAANISHLSLDSLIQETVELGPELQRNSIRYLSINKPGQIGLAMQWQGGNYAKQTLVGLYTKKGQALVLLSASEAEQRKLRGYLGVLPLLGMEAILPLGRYKEM